MAEGPDFLFFLFVLSLDLAVRPLMWRSLKLPTRSLAPRLPRPTVFLSSSLVLNYTYKLAVPLFSFKGPPPPAVLNALLVSSSFTLLVIGIKTTERTPPSDLRPFLSVLSSLETLDSRPPPPSRPRSNPLHPSLLHQTHHPSLRPRRTRHARRSGVTGRLRLRGNRGRHGSPDGARGEGRQEGVGGAGED